MIDDELRAWLQRAVDLAKSDIGALPKLADAETAECLRSDYHIAEILETEDLIVFAPDLSSAAFARCNEGVSYFAYFHGLEIKSRRMQGLCFYYMPDSTMSRALDANREHRKTHSKYQPKEVNVPAGSLTFQVQGSAAVPYTVAFWKEGDNITARCNCTAGRFKALCKHRLAVLAGDISHVLGANPDHFDALAAMLNDSDVADVYSRFVKGVPGAKEELRKAFND